MGGDGHVTQEKQPQIGASASFSSYGGSGRVASNALEYYYSGGSSSSSIVMGGRSFSDVGSAGRPPPSAAASTASSATTSTNTNTNNSASWSPNSSSSSSGNPNNSWNQLRLDPEVKRRSRLASYKAIAFEGKMKASVRRSFRWIKTKYLDIVHGNP